MSGGGRESVLRDLCVAFLWATIVALIIVAPGVFSRTIEFVYTAF